MPAQRGAGVRRAPAAAAWGRLTGWTTRPLASFHLVLALAGILTVVGVVMVSSASSVASYDPRTPGQGSLFVKHLTYVALGAGAFWLGLRVPLATIRRWSGGGTGGGTCWCPSSR